MKCPYCNSDHMYPLNPGKNLTYTLGIAQKDSGDKGTELNRVIFIDAFVCQKCHGLLLKTDAWEK